jgi:peptidoglycan hydrolase-like protein with peptidoglycan-binding domain
MNNMGEIVFQVPTTFTEESWEGDRDSILGLVQMPHKSTFDGEGLYGAMPASLWGWPWANNYNATYVVKVNFMGKSLYWHKWAVVPLMKVQDQLRAEGWDKKYHWEDLQTWNKRMIAGTKIPSNHAWPTAIDINPRQNPMRYDNKLVTDIPYRVVEIFKRYGFKWGGEYRTVKDAMHFEYLGPPVKEYDTSRSLELTDPYMKGDDVKELQTLLQYYGYALTNDDIDGVFGPHTDAWVRSYQASKMLESDGIVGSITWTSLRSKLEDRVLRRGSEGKDVYWVQRVLDKVGIVEWTDEAFDGRFGQATKEAVEDFQEKYELKVDGVVGPNTWKKLRYQSNIFADNKSSGPLKFSFKNNYNIGR